MVLVEGYKVVDWLKVDLLVRDCEAHGVSSHGWHVLHRLEKRTSRSAMAADRAAVWLFQLHQSQQRVLSTIWI